MSAGLFFFVVGPSGSGKDTLIDGARAALAPSGRYVFARRVITRPAGSAGEDHEPATEVVFAAREADDGFLITWNAHGLRYGLPRSLLDALEGGRHVVANGSRAVIQSLDQAGSRTTRTRTSAKPARSVATSSGCSKCTISTSCTSPSSTNSACLASDFWR